MSDPLIEEVVAAVAPRVHELVGIPVLVQDIEMPFDEQERRQAKLPPAEDPLAGKPAQRRPRRK